MSDFHENNTFEVMASCTHTDHTTYLNWQLFYFVYTFYASLLQPSRELKPTPEKKCLLHVPLDDTVQKQTVIGDFSKKDEKL